MLPLYVRKLVGKRSLLIGAILVLGICFVFFALTQYRAARITPATVPQEPFGEMIRLGTVSPPEYTEAIAEKVAKSQGFAVVISYTDRGFEPETVRIAHGDTVRFTNNSSGELWVASHEGARVYPRSYDACGSSDLDSCGTFPPQDFWEFTFEERGEWGVTNNLDKSKRVTVIVE